MMSSHCRAADDEIIMSSAMRIYQMCNYIFCLHIQSLTHINFKRNIKQTALMKIRKNERVINHLSLVLMIFIPKFCALFLLTLFQM